MHVGGARLKHVGGCGCRFGAVPEEDVGARAAPQPETGPASRLKPFLLKGNVGKAAYLNQTSGCDFLEGAEGELPLNPRVT